jgi:hypothetical protein
MLLFTEGKQSEKQSEKKVLGFFRSSKEVALKCDCCKALLTINIFFWSLPSLILKIVL